MRKGVSLALAVVLTVATFACAPREEKQVAQFDADELAQDIEALDQLRAVGSDMSKPHEIDFYLYVPSEADAKAVEAALRSLGYDVLIRAGENEINWLCIASRTMRPTIQELTNARGVFKGLALRHSGAYNGWQAAIVR